MSDSIEHIQSLLRGEISATETYDQALERLDASDGSVHIRRIREEHHRAVEILRRHARTAGAEPEDDSGVWGAFAKSVQGVSKLLGDKASLLALKEGEEHGLREYNEALESGHLPPLLAELVRSDLLPRQKEHISTLESLTASA